MPDDIKDPEGMNPFHYDPKYDQSLNTFEPGAGSLDNYLQSIAFEVLKTKISREKLNDLKMTLDKKGLLNRNLGDPEFRDAVGVLLKRMKMARKVALTCLQI